MSIKVDTGRIKELLTDYLLANEDEIVAEISDDLRLILMNDDMFDDDDDGLEQEEAEMRAIEKVTRNIIGNAIEAIQRARY